MSGAVRSVSGRLSARTVVITGAGSGIGFAGVHRFGAEGANVVALDIDGAAARRALKSADCPGLALTVDVTDATATQAAIRETLQRFGAIDCYFNNAGRSHAPAFVEAISEETWDEVVDTNLRAFFLAARIVVPVMKAQRRGVILVTASMGALRPRPQLAAYTAAKAGAIALVKQIAIEVAEFRIRVNAICPVATDTPMLARAGPEVTRSIAGQIPLGRLARPEDIAATAAFLASDDAAMITGAAIQVDGGRGI